MAGETNLNKLLQNMQPELNEGDYVFTVVLELEEKFIKNTISIFKEEEGYTLIMEKNLADLFDLKYEYIASWITLKVHSSLEAVGLTAVFAHSLADHDISCNVVAAFHHDHIFVHKNDKYKALGVLQSLSATNF
jgi:uncharacterized protein